MVNARAARAYSAPNRMWRVLIALTGLALASACAGAPGGSDWGAPVGLYGHQSRGAVPSGSSSDQKLGRPYQVNGAWYVPARDDDYNEVGTASWYGPQFDGKRTANGEIFHQYAISAAHTTLPLPSVVEVRNLENGRTINVRVNDRGPFVGDRIIDLSRGAARELGFERQGTARVRVRYLGPATGDDSQVYAVNAPESADRSYRRDAPGVYSPAAPSLRADRRGDIYVQVASFRDRDRARALVRRLGPSGPVFISRARVDGRTWNRVVIGPWRDMSGAREARAEVARLGFPDAQIVNRR